MEVVLGLSMTGATVRVVLVEGERADGVTIEIEAFDTVAPEGVPKPSASEQVSNAILATRQNAVSIGHHLVVSGVAWEDEAQQAALRDSLIARGLDNVMLMSEQVAAAALAQTIGCALGYDTTAVLLIKFDTVTLSIVNSADGSIADGRSCNYGGAELVDVLPEIASSLETTHPRPQGVVIVGSCVEIGAVKSRLESLLPVPVIVPEEPDLGLARGAALAAANAVGLEAPTLALAYSQDPDGNEVKLSAADTVVTPPVEVELEEDPDSVVARIGRGLLLPVGSTVGAIGVVAVVTLVMSFAVSIGTTTGANRATPAAENVIAPGVVVPTLLPVQVPAAAPGPSPVPAAVPGPGTVPQAQVIQPPPPPASPEPVVIAAETPVAAPVITPAPKQRVPAPVVQQPAPSRVITEPEPVAAATPLPAAPEAVEPPPVEAPPIPAPVAAIPAPVAAPRPVAFPPPVAAGPVPPPPQAPPVAFPWGPPTLQIGPLRIPLGPQPAASPSEQLSTGPQSVQSAPQQAPQPPAWSPAQAPPPPLGGRDSGRERWWWWLWR